MKWLNDLKLAIINKDIVNIGKLISKIPKITNLAKAGEALALINEAISIVDAEKQNTLNALNKIKQTKAFLESH